MRTFKVDRVVIAFSRESAERTVDVIREVRDHDVQIDVVPRLFDVIGQKITLHSIEALPMVGLPPVRISPSSQLVKRLIDMVGASILLLLTLPLFVGAAVAILIDSRGPILFRQHRIGQGMREFTLLKFRSMKVGTDPSVHRDYVRRTMTANATVGENGMYKLDRSDSVTRVGRWLRKTSIDELPQLINVLKGDMSLVGPRPCLPYETEHFRPHHFERFLVPSGITGLWQVAARARSTFGEALDMDVAYARGWSLAPRSSSALQDATPARQTTGNGMIHPLDQWASPEDEPVRVAVVGLGYWGPNLVRNLHEHPGAEVVAVCDSREERLGKMARRYPSVTATTDFESILSDDSIEAVAIATPVSSHFPLASAVLEAGKHVFIEKPLAASAEEARELIELAERQGLVLMPGHTFLYSPPVNLIADLLRVGDLGEIYFVSMSRVNLGLHQPDVSVAWDLGPHDFSILRYWLEETPLHVSAISRGCIIPTIPDVAFIDLEYASGTISHVELSWLAPSKLRRTTIVGSEKMLIYDDTSTEPVRVFDSGVLLKDPQSFGEYQLTYRTGDIVSLQIPAAEPLLLEMGDFCDAIRTGRTPRSSAQIGLEVVRTIEAVDESFAREGARVRLDLDHDVVAA